MALLLGALVLGFATWEVVTEFSRVREIYVSLPANDRRHLQGFLGGVVVLTNCLVIAVLIVRRLVGGLKRVAKARRAATPPNVNLAVEARGKERP
jgi:hypothetical protein